MLTIRDLQGNEHAITAIKKHSKELNGDDKLELIIHQQKNRSIDLIDISEMWIVTFKNIEYKIIYLERITKGNSFYLSVKAIPLFYDEFSTSVIHYVTNGSTTSTDAFTRIFSGTSFNFSLQTPSSAKSWDGFGKGENRLELFKKALDKYGYEFYIEGKTVYLKNLIGNDTNFMYKYKLNASDVKQAVDATGLYTHIKGFGDLPEDYKDYLNEAKLKREYTSDLAAILGVREAPPIVDGRIKNATTLDEAMKEVVESSLNVTVTAKLHDLRKQGYDVAQPKIGDRSFLIDERINVNVDIRIYGLVEEYNERDELMKCDITFGSQSIFKRQSAKISEISKAMQELLNGKIQLPFNVLDDVSKDMLNKIKSVSTELLLEDGIFAIDPNNPNNIVGINSAGWFISTDGGATAQTIATADGIVANAITSGEILTHLIRIVGTENLFYIDGNELRAVDPTNVNRYTSITPKGAYFKGGSITIETSSGRKVIMNGYLNRSQTTTTRLPSFRTERVEIIGNWYATDSTNWERVESEYVVHEARHFVMSCGINEWGYAMNVNARAKLASTGSLSNTITTSGMESGSGYAWIKIDLGEPLDVPASKEIHYEFRTSNGAGKGRMHLGNRFLTDNPPTG